MTKKDASLGHRKRLREKFLRSGLGGFHDYEVIELLLTLGSPRRDCKPQAKEVMKRFKTLRGALSASPEELGQIKGIGPHSAFGIKLVQEVAAEFLRQKTIDKPVYKTGKEIFDYLYHSMRDLKAELFKVIYLNGQNQIIDIPGYLFIIFTGLGVAGGVVVDKDERDSIMLDGVFHDFPGIDRAGVNRPLKEVSDINNLVLAIQVDDLE
jgi:DNA repair protein RadC